MSKIVYLYVKTSPSLLLPINCNDDQNYVHQFSTTFKPHTFYMWSHYYPQDRYELFYSFYSFYFFSQDQRKIAKPFDSTLIFIINNSQTRLHRDHKAKLKTNSYQDFNLLDKDITKRIELSKTVKIGVWWWYDTGATPPSLAVAKGSSHTHVIMSSEVIEVVMMTVDNCKLSVKVPPTCR